MLIKPKALKNGDTIGIVAPGGPFAMEKLYQGADRLKEYGFNIQFEENIFEQEDYLAGSDKRRATELNKMFMDPNIQAIFCARGGYGSARIIPLLDPQIIKANPKIFIGFSDITLLHLYFNLVCSMVSFHGPMVATDQIVQIKESTKNSLLGALKKNLPLPPVTFSKDKVIRKGFGKGILTGGCLTLLIHSIGTPYEINTDNKILIIEDRNEAPYRIDRMLYHLKAAGKLERVSGVVFGDMLSCYQNYIKGGNDKKLRHIIDTIFSNQDIPICIGLPFGHELENITIPLGIEATLDTNKCLLLFNENALTG